MESVDVQRNWCRIRNFGRSWLRERSSPQRPWRLVLAAKRLKQKPPKTWTDMNIRFVSFCIYMYHHVSTLLFLRGGFILPFWLVMIQDQAVGERIGVGVATVTPTWPVVNNELPTCSGESHQDIDPQVQDYIHNISWFDDVRWRLIDYIGFNTYHPHMGSMSTNNQTQLIIIGLVRI